LILVLSAATTLWPVSSFAQKPTDSSTVDELPVRSQQPPPKTSELKQLLSDDPERAAEEFVNKTANEAKEAVEILSKEAEELRVRLQKVKAALRRLQSVQRALETPEDYEPMPMPARYSSGQ
jgi:hypothetical protein